MAVDRRNYTRTVGGVGVPSVEFPQFSQQAEMFSEVGKRIDAIKDFVIEKGSDEAVKRGKAFGVANPVNVADFLNADPVTKEKFLSTGTTAFDKAVDAVRINLLTTDIEAASTAQINELLTTAKEAIGTPNEPSADSMAALLFGIADGAKDALVSDPESALTVYSSLATTANAAYKSYLDDVYDNGVAQLKATAAADAQELIVSIPSYVGQDSKADFETMGGEFNLVELGFEIDDDANTKFRWEDQVELVIERGKNKLLSVGASPTQVANYVKDAYAAVSEAAKQRLYVKYVANDDYYDESITDVENAINMNNAFKQEDFTMFGEDDMPRRLYDSIEDKESFLNSVNEYKNKVVTIFDNEDKIHEEKVKVKIADEQLKFDKAYLENDVDTMNSSLETQKELAEKNPEDYGQMYENNLRKSSNYISPIKDGRDDITYVSLERGLYRGEISLADIEYAANNNHITSGRPPGSDTKSQETILTELFYRLQDRGLKESVNFIRSSLGFGLLDENGRLLDNGAIQILKATGKLAEREAQMTALTRDLDVYAFQNPDATGEQLKDYARSLLTEENTFRGINEELDILSGTINRIPNGAILNNMLTFNNFIVDQNPTLKEGDYKNWLQYGEDNPDNFDEVIIKPLERHFFSENKKVMPLLPPGSDELSDLIDKLQEYNQLLEKRKKLKGASE
jgi:hypothetical protein